MTDIKYYEPGEPVKCVQEGCKAQFHRPQDAQDALSLQAIAQLHGWKAADRNGETLRCPMHGSAA
jgi:hypothetical protein